MENILSLLGIAPEKAVMVILAAFMLPLAFQKPANANKMRLRLIRGLFSALVLYMIGLQLKIEELSLGTLFTAIFDVTVVVLTSTIVALAVYLLAAWIFCCRISEIWDKILGR